MLHDIPKMQQIGVNNMFSLWLTKNMIVKTTMIVHAIQHHLNFQLVRFVSIILNDIEIISNTWLLQDCIYQMSVLDRL